MKRTYDVANNGPHPYSFPYQPYDLQIKLMTDMYEVISQGHVGIFESPTGTGKTLTSLCSALTFIEEENKSRRVHVNENRKKATRLREAIDDDTYDESLDKFRESEELLRKAEIETEKFQRIQRRIDEAKERMKDHLLLKPKELDIEEIGMPPKEDPPKHLKLVYATRTHSQIGQLVDELKLTRFKPRVVSVGSRAKLCPNVEVKSLPNNLAGDKCKDLREANQCSFYKRSKTRLIADLILTGNANGMVQTEFQGGSFHACSYYGTREAVPYCDLVFVPYATLFDEDMRQSVGLNIDSDTVVIVDEAHNLFSTLTEMSSCTINLNHMRTGIQILSIFMNEQAERLTSSDFKNLKLFRTCIEIAGRMLHGQDFEKMRNLNFKTYKFMDIVFGGEGMRFIRAIEAARKGVLFSRIRSFMRRRTITAVQDENIPNESVSGVQRLLNARHGNTIQSPMTQQAPPSLEPEDTDKFPLFQLAEFFSSLGGAGDNFEVVVSLSDSENPRQPRHYHLLCLHGGERFRSIVSEARSTILIGGTMQPSDLVLSLLMRDCGVCRERIDEYSYGHIINSDNLRIVTITSDHIGPLTLTYGAVQTKVIHHRILAQMIPFLNDTPNGLTVFFPSRAFLTNFLIEVKLTKPPGYLELAHRGFYLEGVHDDDFRRYTEKAKMKKATFFAVIGGKFSEGVNFKDEIARCVIIVGLPYPNTFSDEFRAKTEFLKDHYGDEGMVSRMPLNQCMTAVNQTIGRVVRHKNDYGVVVLLDNRYKEDRHVKTMSSWMLPCFRQTTTRLDARNEIRGFRGIF